MKMAAREQNVQAGFDPSVRPDAFDEEGFVLRTLDANTLLVTGNNDGPYIVTVFAAYALLEELGCRCYFPSDWGEIVTEQTTITVLDFSGCLQSAASSITSRTGSAASASAGGRPATAASSIRQSNMALRPLIGPMRSAGPGTGTSASPMVHT